MFAKLHLVTSVLAVAALTLPATIGFAESHSAPEEVSSEPPADVEFKDGKVVFRSALDNAPMEFEYRTDQELTPEVEEFYTTGINPYAGDADAIEAGGKQYKKLCQSCHLKDGAGRIGPSLNDDKWERPRTHTDVGRFEIIYGGGAGAMQAFGRRADQDDLLKVMAFIDTFRTAE